MMHLNRRPAASAAALLLLTMAGGIALPTVQSWGTDVVQDEWRYFDTACGPPLWTRVLYVHGQATTVEALPPEMRDCDIRDAKQRERERFYFTEAQVERNDKGEVRPKPGAVPKRLED